MTFLHTKVLVGVMGATDYLVEGELQGRQTYHANGIAFINGLRNGALEYKSCSASRWV